MIKLLEENLELMVREDEVALVLLAFREWADLARLLDARDGDPELRDWFAYRDAHLQRLDELVLIPGRMTPLGIRD